MRSCYRRDGIRFNRKFLGVKQACRKDTLEVRADNAGARAFYERLGYRRLALLPGYYQGREDALRLERSLG